jgi:hypothetical protein
VTVVCCMSPTGIFVPPAIIFGESGSSFSLVSGYGLYDRVIEVRSQAEERGFFCCLCVQTGSGAHPAS